MTTNRRGGLQRRWLGGGCRGVEQAAAAADREIDLGEQRVDDDPDDQDDDDDRACTGEIEVLLVDREQLTDRELADDRYEQLGRHQAAPGERPALFQPTDEGGQRRGQDQVPVQRDAAQAHGLPGAQQQRRRVVHTRDQPVGDGRGGPHDDHEQDRRLVLAEQDDGERGPRDRRHGRQAGNNRADRRAQRRDPRHQDADDRADDQRRRIADNGAPQGPSDGLPELGVLHLAPQVGEDRTRALQHVALPPAEGHQLPDGQNQRYRQQLRPGRRPDLARDPAGVSSGPFRLEFQLVKAAQRL